jgi:hypothetical protein
LKNWKQIKYAFGKKTEAQAQKMPQPLLVLIIGEYL